MADGSKYGFLNYTDTAFAIKQKEKEHRQKFYKAQTCCLNCGWSGTLEKEKGQRVKGTPCPNCECKLGVED